VVGIILAGTGMSVGKLRAGISLTHESSSVSDPLLDHLYPFRGSGKEIKQMKWIRIKAKIIKRRVRRCTVTALLNH
jgi:hypothetical protein